MPGRSQCYDFKSTFNGKIGRKNGDFQSIESNFVKNDRNIGFCEKRQIFSQKIGEKRRKL
jgi:hypothetical protein